MTRQIAAATIDLAAKANKANLPGAASMDAHKNFGNLLSSILTGIMVLAAIMVLLYLIWGGIEWISSGGDKSKTEAARNKITNSVLGIIVLGASTAIFMLIQTFLGICVLSFTGSC